MTTRLWQNVVEKHLVTAIAVPHNEVGVNGRNNERI